MTSELQSQPTNIVLQEQDQEGGLQLGRFVSAIRRHILVVIGITTLAATAALLKAVTATPTYQSKFELLTPPETLETQIISTLNKDALSNQSDIVGVAVDDTKLKILKSPRVMTPIVETIQARYPAVTYGKVISDLRITPDKTGNTLSVDYQSENPDEVIYVLEVVAEAYLRFSLEDRQNDIYRGIDFVDEQLPVVRDRVEELAGELEDLRQRSNLIDPLLQGEQLSEQTSKFTAEQLDLRVQIREAQALYRDLQQELSASQELAATSVLLDSARYQDLLNQLLAIDSQIAQELTLYLADSPEIEVLEDQRDNLKPLLKQEGVRVQRQLANHISELQDRDQALTETISSLNSQIKQLSTIAREYNRIERELEIATTNLNQFLTKREALRIDAAQRQTPWEMLVPPPPPKASIASAKTNLVLGCFLGILVGSGIAILLDRIGGKIHSVKELKEVVPLPILGNIPHEVLLEAENSLTMSLNQLSQLGLNVDITSVMRQHEASSRDTNTPFMEAFRRLATNLQLSRPDSHIRFLTITSAIPNMGKSTVTFHLAHAFAMTGKKVLMIDTDLRRPSLHRLCNLPGNRGLSNYAVGDFELDEVIVNLPIHKNLNLLPAGSVPPDATAILTAQRVKELFAQVTESFDLVIADTPPLLGFADAFIMTAQTQGTLLVAKLGDIKFVQMQMAMDELSIAKVPVFGIVANGVQQTSESTYSYYQYYREKYEINGDDSQLPTYAEDTPNGYFEPSWWSQLPQHLLAQVSKTFGGKR